MPARSETSGARLKVMFIVPSWNRDSSAQFGGDLWDVGSGVAGRIRPPAESVPAMAHWGRTSRARASVIAPTSRPPRQEERSATALRISSRCAAARRRCAAQLRRPRFESPSPFGLLQAHVVLDRLHAADGAGNLNRLVFRGLRGHETAQL